MRGGNPLHFVPGHTILIATPRTVEIVTVTTEPVTMAFSILR